MFSTLASTNDPNALDDGSYLFDQSNDDLLSLPLSNDSIHLKGSIAPIAGLGNLEYGRDSAASSVHYGDSHDTSEPSTDHMSGIEERGRTRSPFANGYGSRYTPSPLQYPYTTHPTTTVGADHSSVKPSSNLDGDLVHRVANEPVNSREEHQPMLEKLQGTHTFIARTPQSLNRDSQSSSTSEVVQSHKKTTKPAYPQNSPGRNSDGNVY
jgi:hypothetical protein